jgi:hypothetical protein
MDGGFPAGVHQRRCGAAPDPDHVCRVSIAESHELRERCEVGDGSRGPFSRDGLDGPARADETWRAGWLQPGWAKVRGMSLPSRGTRQTILPLGFLLG